MNGFFLTLIIIYALSLGISLTEHGKERKGKNNFYISLVSVSISLFLIYFAIKTGF